MDIDVQRSKQASKMLSFGRNGKKNNKKKTSVSTSLKAVDSFPASGKFCHLLIIFANSLDPDQAPQNVGSDLNPNCLTLWWYSWKIFWKS